MYNKMDKKPGESGFFALISRPLIPDYRGTVCMEEVSTWSYIIRQINHIFAVIHGKIAC
jgi:hypothetical protein